MFFVLPPQDSEKLNPDALKKPVDEDGKEPMCYHSVSLPFYEELIHSFQAKACIDATCLDGLCALACIKAKILYIGFAFTEDCFSLPLGLSPEATNFI